MPWDGPSPRKSGALMVDPVLRTGCWTHATAKPHDPDRALPEDGKRPMCDGPRERLRRTAAAAP